MRLLVSFLILVIAVSVFSVLNQTDATGQTGSARTPSTRVGRSSDGGQPKQRPLKQSPGSVNVRPRVTASQPGVPAVKVDVDRHRVPLGDLVRFTLTPSSVVAPGSGYKVTLYFGDREHELMSQSSIDHLYRKPGDFVYSILVEPVAPPTPAPPLPGVKLSATPRSVEINRSIEFAAELSHSYPNIKYRFVFADGSPTDWQDSQQTTHSYSSPGSYQAYVDIGLGNSGTVKRVQGSTRQTIQVTPPPPKTIAVDLTADRVTVQAKDEVRFLARVDPSEPNIRYRSDFGDRSGAAAWQTSPQTKHIYSSSGTYAARVDVQIASSRSGPQTASSRPLPIKVAPVPLPGVALSAIPRSVLAGVPVYFRATADSPSSKTLYRFNFGDGSPPSDWQATMEATHIYSLAGNFPAFVEIGSASNGPPNGSLAAMAASGKEQVQVLPTGLTSTATPTPVTNTSTPLSGTPTPSPGTPTSSPGTPTPLAGTPTPSPGTPTSDSSASPLIGDVTPTTSPTGTPTPTPSPNSGGSLNNWWKYLLLALILLAGYQGWKYFYAPRPTLVPNLDPGTSALGAEGGPLSINFQMELDPNLTDGQYAVNTNEGSFIKSERKSDG